MQNTIAGAINVATRKPTEETEGYLEGEYFSETDQWGVTGVVSGPLADNSLRALGGQLQV